MARPLAVVIMAAGKGTRMKNDAIAKVMHTIGGKPMVEHVVELAVHMRSERIVVVVGWHKDAVIQHLGGTGHNVVCVEQMPQLGTGHAVMQAEQALAGFDGDVLVLSGDVPLLTEKTIGQLVGFHRSSPAAATLLTAILDDPSGYGRILRDGPGGSVLGIVEHKDASPEQLKVKEINTGIYVYDKVQLFEGLKHITTDNVQHEYYLTDVFQYFWKNHFPIRAVAVEEAIEVQGINTVDQLEAARAAFEVRRG
jgi:UDP-N-acetylglucosamine pyrophosphorylase